LREEIKMECPKCGHAMAKTDWSPPEGMDPYLVEYECLNAKCNYKFYEPRGESVKQHGKTEKMFTRAKN